jgi:hypothetical protein
MQFQIVALASLSLFSSSAMGCQGTPVETKAPVPVMATTGTCPAKDLQHLVGQSKTVLQTIRFGGEVRIEEPGFMYTADYRENRTRIVLGEDNTIKQVICG